MIQSCVSFFRIYEDHDSYLCRQCNLQCLELSPGQNCSSNEASPMDLANPRTPQRYNMGFPRLILNHDSILSRTERLRDTNTCNKLVNDAYCLGFRKMLLWSSKNVLSQLCKKVKVQEMALDHIPFASFLEGKGRGKGFQQHWLISLCTPINGGQQNPELSVQYFPSLFFHLKPYCILH